MSLISNTTPNYDELSSLESKSYTFDFTNVLSPGDIVATPTVKITDLTTGKLSPKNLSGAASISVNLVSQTIFNLIPNHRYSLEMYVNLSTGKILGGTLEIFCPR